MNGYSLFLRILSKCCITLSLLRSGVCDAQELRGPVDLSGQRSIYGEVISPQPCPAVETLPKVVSSISFYSDPPHYSVINYDQLQEFYKAVAPIRNGEEAIARALSAFVRAEPASAVPFGECLLRHIMQFAVDDAMVETTEMRGTGQVRLFSVTPVFAYTVLRGNHPISDENVAQIEAWIRRLAERIQRSQREHWYGNNIDYWGAAGLSVAAVALQDRSLLDEALRVAGKGLDEVTARGVLPREMDRGSRALEYGLFATQALAVVLAVAERNQIPALRNRNNHAIIRLMQTMAHSVLEPESFVVLFGNSEAVLPDRIYPQNLAWSALAARLFPDAQRIHEMYCWKRPLYSFRAGGDWDILFGNAHQCRVLAPN